MEIVGDLKKYEWGKFGMQSKVAQLAKLNQNDFNPSQDDTFAELWMGDHPSGPSTLKGNGKSLADVINANRMDLIGGMDKLPFLFKVLSINKALSIQVHPNKEEAEELYAARPDLYKDPNHKPELAIALTPFLALCGFRPYNEIHSLLNANPELIDLLGVNNVAKILSEPATGLKECFEKLMKSTNLAVAACITRIQTRLGERNDSDDILKSVFITLNRDFPGDVGVLSVFFLNILELRPGQAIYLPAKEPHAYLDGDCIECMACSDNVVRAGLTPKFKDVETLVRMLNYDDVVPASNKIFQPTSHPSLAHTRLFIPKVKDFAVAEIVVPFAEPEYTIENREFGSILLVLSGKGELVMNGNYQPVGIGPGSIIFLPSNAGKEIKLQIESTEADFIAYQAMYNDF